MAAALTLAACGSSDDVDTPSADGSSVPAPSTDTPGSTPTSSATTSPTTAEATDVATDAPVETGPDEDATVVVTFAGWNTASAAVEVDGFVPAVVEPDGVCTVTLTNGGRVVSVQVAATADVTSTACGGASVPASDLTPGTWTAVLSYQSAQSAGSSDPIEVVVP
ncbi:hypothetical protein ACI8AA_22740 [Geodermatophilus sp. SYSU D01180]